MRRGFGRRRLGGRGIGLIGSAIAGPTTSDVCAVASMKFLIGELMTLGFGTEAQDDFVAVHRVDVKWIATREPVQQGCGESLRFSGLNDERSAIAQR